jgi:formylglycine-generating enzyme required for sulfatase activity
MLKCVREALVKSEEPLKECLKNTQLNWQAHYNGLLCLKEIGSDKAKEAVELALKAKHPKVASFAQELLVEWGRIKLEEEIEPITGLPRLIFNPMEDNAEYILIPAGTYKMGATGKQVKVEPFYLAKFLVTNRLYRRFIEATKYKKPEYWDDKRFNGDDQPVVGVSWHDAKAYCDWLTENNKDGKVYRLPKEEEWEWAASGGKREYPWGNEPIDKSRKTMMEISDTPHRWVIILPGLPLRE